MINFKDPKDQTPSALAVLGMLLIGASVIVSIFFLKGIDANAYAAKARKDQNEFEKRKEKARANKVTYSDAIERYLWTEKEDLVTPAALTILSKRAAENNLRMISYRPMKSTEIPTGILLPMQFTIDGPFASVAAMLETLEQPGSKLAVQQVQFASQEGQSDLVSANISLVAFLAKPEPVKVEPKKDTTSPKTSPSVNPITKAGNKTIPKTTHG